MAQSERGDKEGAGKEHAAAREHCVDLPGDSFEIEATKISVDNIRRYFNHCWRYMDAYRKGLSLERANYAVKKYTSHRRIPAHIIMDINILC